MLHVFFLNKKFSIAQDWATVVTYPADGEQTTAGVTASWIPAHLGECVCAALVLLTSQEDLPGGVFYHHKQVAFFFFFPHRILFHALHTLIPLSHTWTCDEVRDLQAEWSEACDLHHCMCKERWLETPTSVSWLCNMCINVDSALFQRVAQRITSKTTRGKQLLTSASQLLRCVGWESLCIDLPLQQTLNNKPQTSWESWRLHPTACTRPRSTSCHCVKTNRKLPEDGWVTEAEESADERWWHPEFPGQRSLLFICRGRVGFSILKGHSH